MQEINLDIKNVIDIIIKTINKNISVLADKYLNRDVSVVYKLKNNKIRLKSEDIVKIVDFAISESTLTQQKIIKEKLIELVKQSSVQEDLKSSILNLENFESFLTEVLNIATLIQKDKSLNKESDKSRLKNDCSINRDEERNEVSLDNLKTKYSDKQNDGEYSGVVKFSLRLDKNKSSENSKEGPKIEIKNVDFNNNTDLMRRLQRYVQGKMTLGLIIMVIVTGFVITRAANNSNSDAETKEGKSTYTATSKDNKGKGLESDQSVLSGKGKETDSNVVTATIQPIATPTKYVEPTLKPQLTSEVSARPPKKARQNPKPAQKSDSVSEQANNMSNSNSIIYFSNSQGDNNKCVQGNNSFIDEEK
ncbi:MAG: hypothetical protein Q8942_05360 [Bacillota bacterium]|nr:hypothetical protein [Bacillota bacterium]